MIKIQKGKQKTRKENGKSMNEKNVHQYDDIMHLPHHTSSKHKRMSNQDRAAQFSPFAALNGYDAAIKETSRWTDERMELDEEMIGELNEKLQILREHLGEKIEVEVTYFVPDEKKAGGAYVSCSGGVYRVDQQRCRIVMEDRRKIPFGQICRLEGAVFERD